MDLLILINLESAAVANNRHQIHGPNTEIPAKLGDSLHIANIAKLTEMMELDVKGIEDVISLSSIENGDYFENEKPLE